MRHALTVDLEDYFMSPPEIGPGDWAGYGGRLEQSVPRLLDWLAEGGHEATFFALGIVARDAPRLVQRIAEAGHELAIHGWDHRPVRALGAEVFADHLARARDAVQSATGEPVRGFRAAAFSLDGGTPWAYDVLLDQGFAYDASSAPWYGWLYGEPLARAEVHYRRAPSGRTLLEIPLTALGLRPFRIPVAGGFFLRLYPYAMTRGLLRRCERRSRPAIAYLHPWEVESEHPKLRLSRAQRVIHYTGLRGSPDKIRRLLGDFRFASLRSLLADGSLSARRAPHGEPATRAA